MEEKLGFVAMNLVFQDSSFLWDVSQNGGGCHSLVRSLRGCGLSLGKELTEFLRFPQRGEVTLANAL